MKKTTVHKIKYGIQLLYVISFIIVGIIFKDEFSIIVVEPKIISYLFIGSMLIAMIAIIVLSIVELLKSEKTLKNENIKYIENRIKYHKKIISEYEKQIIELNE